MEKPAHYRNKNKKSPSKSKSAKRRKSDGPTCSMFLAELTRKLILKKRQEEESPKNIVQMIIESITNALPIKFSKQTPPKNDSPIEIENLQNFAPELLPNHTLDIPLPAITKEDVSGVEIIESKSGFVMPKMPLTTSDVFKQAIEIRKPTEMEDAAVNTGSDRDVASEIAKHVGTLKKISLIAEEFNQKTAKNLKEIVNSVQEDLIKKLEEIKAEQKITQHATSVKIQDEVEQEEKQ